MGRIRNLFALGTLMRNRHLPPAALRRLQEQRLCALVRHAHDNVPLYRSRFQAAGISPDDVRSLSDLQRLPITTKPDLQAAGPELSVATGVDLASCLSRSTGGTTGRPLKLFRSQREKDSIDLVTLRGLLVIGFRPQDLLCRVGLQSPSAPRLSHRLGLFRTEPASSLLPTSEQARVLRELQPTILWVLPTTLWALLHAVDYHLDEIVRPGVLITSGEALDQSLRQRILQDSDAELFNFYYSAEFEPIATECPAHEGLHLNADCLILECVDDNGQAVEPGEPGIVVLTSLLRYVQPLIRYRLGDTCVLLDKPCSCGSSLPLIHLLVGRHRDVIQLPSGALRSPTGLPITLYGFDGFEQYRFIQESIDRIVLQLVPCGSMPESQLSEMRSRLLQYLGEPVTLDIELVESIPLEKPVTSNFVSRLPRPAL